MRGSGAIMKKMWGLQRWGKTRERGKRAFVLRKGVLGWGGFMYVVMSAFQISGHPRHWWFILFLAAPLWLGGGALWGALTWWGMERAYARQVQRAGDI